MGMVFRRRLCPPSPQPPPRGAEPIPLGGEGGQSHQLMWYNNAASNPNPHIRRTILCQPVGTIYFQRSAWGWR